MSYPGHWIRSPGDKQVLGTDVLKLSSTTRFAMRVGLLNYGQPDDATVKRFIKKGHRNALLKQLKIEEVPGRANVYRELKVKAVPPTDSTRFDRTTPNVIPKIKAPRKPEHLLLQYPLPDQSSYHVANRRRIWGSDLNQFGYASVLKQWADRERRKPFPRLIPRPDGSLVPPVVPPA